MRRLNIVFSCACVSMIVFSVLTMTIPDSSALAFTESEVRTFQKEIAARPLGERIALWAEKFVGTPYDPDPLGEYVTKRVIVADGRVDCMYLAFRSLELAMSNTPEEAVIVALDKRFSGKGLLKDDMIVNYEERFQYGEDMIDSGKWGREVTGDVGLLAYIDGSRGREKVGIISKDGLLALLKEKETAGARLRSGDFIFFIKAPEKRVVGEIVGHIGIIKKEGADLYLIHAGGKKNSGGKVKKLFFDEYLRSMPFAGVRVSRFD